MDNRRNYERVRIPESAGIYAIDDGGKRMGPVRELGLGGMLVDESQGIHRHVKTVSCYKTAEGVGFHFHTLEPQAAVEVGVIIGKHHPASAKQ